MSHLPQFLHAESLCFIQFVNPYQLFYYCTASLLVKKCICFVFCFSQSHVNKKGSIYGLFFLLFCCCCHVANGPVVHVATQIDRALLPGSGNAALRVKSDFRIS